MYGGTVESREIEYIYNLFVESIVSIMDIFVKKKKKKNTALLKMCNFA